MSNVCTGCNQEINWNKKIREVLGWKGPLNPDNTKHLCPAFESKRQQKQDKPTIATYDYSKTEVGGQGKKYEVIGVPAQQVVADARSKEIQQAHKENMEASKNLTTAINRLADVLGMMTLSQLGGDLEKETARRRLLDLYKQQQ